MAEKKRLEEELRIAREIQMSLLPQGPLAMPGLSMTALCVPAREVGGDYYDFLPLDDHRLGVLIADVSGKGTSAALYMAELKGLMLSLSQIHTSPRELLIAANRIIADNLDSRSFITMTYAVIDLEARTMTYARAGHTPLILPAGTRRRAGDVQVLAPDGMVLGLKHRQRRDVRASCSRSRRCRCAPGDLFVLFTDGITEAMNAAEDCSARSGWAQLVEEHADLPFDELRERILREVARVRRRAGPQHDDMTLILLKVEPTALNAPSPSAAASVAAALPDADAAVRIVMSLRSDALPLAHLPPSAPCQADLVAINGHVYTVDPSQPWVEASPCVASGSCGSERAPRWWRWPAPNARRLDLQGQHGHSRLQRQPRPPDRRRYGADRGRSAEREESPQEAAKLIAEFARTQPKGRWILGGFWDHESWPDKHAADARADRRRHARTTRSSCSGSTATWGWRTAWR